MRKLLLLLVVSTAMVLGGVYLLTAELLLAGIIYSRFVVAGDVLVSLGGYLLWADFVAPLLSIKTWEDR